jgi:two-component system sensor histidine kinase TctE
MGHETEARRGFFAVFRAPEPEQRTIFGEILDWMFAPLLLLWPLSVVLTFTMARSIADQPYDRALEEKSLLIAQRVSAQAYVAGGIPPLIPLSSQGNRSQDLPTYRYQIRLSDGRFLTGDPDIPGHDPDVLPGPGASSIRNARYHGEEVRLSTVQLPAINSSQPSLIVQIAETTEPREALANEIIRGLIFPQFIVLPLAIVLVWFGLTQGLKPLGSLQQRIQERRPEDLSPLQIKGAPEELVPLLSSFNELLERMAELMRLQRRFIADAAHQMKTPLAGIRTQAELALRSNDPAEIRRSLEQLIRSSERAAHVLSQLLTLARTESLDQAQYRLTPVIFAQQLREWAQDWADQALALRHDFGLEVDPAVEELKIWIHPVMVSEMLNNLVDNALRYCSGQGIVTVRLRMSDGKLLLEVEDNGPGIPTAEQSLVFERFYRVLGHQASGSGLGLAIVREIARRHQLELRLESPLASSQMRSGCRFSVFFPLAASGLGEA